MLKLSRCMRLFALIFPMSPNWVQKAGRIGMTSSHLELRPGIRSEVSSQNKVILSQVQQCGGGGLGHHSAPIFFVAISTNDRVSRLCRARTSEMVHFPTPNTGRLEIRQIHYDLIWAFHFLMWGKIIVTQWAISDRHLFSHFRYTDALRKKHAV